MSHPLTDAARLVAKNAYAPYSHWKVGAAAVFDEVPGSVFFGTNVENASYGLTMCAERVAIFTAASAGLRKLKTIAISTLDRDNKAIPCFSPCGACLQVIAEFGTPDTDIILADRGTFKLIDLFPHMFQLP